MCFFPSHRLIDTILETAEIDAFVVPLIIIIIIIILFSTLHQVRQVTVIVDLGLYTTLCFTCFREREEKDKNNKGMVGVSRPGGGDPRTPLSRCAQLLGKP